MTREVILTGLRANNDLHLGNYLGALLPLIDMAKNRSAKYEVYLMMADLHSFSTPIDHDKLQAQINDNLRTYAAAGLPLDIDTVRIFRESHVPAHSELTVLLANFSGFGELSRMTQFKDKSAKLAHERVSAGLFNYPVLMASDILLYSANYIPVGDDQTQHLEFARDIAERFNNKFGEVFTVPKAAKDQHKFFGKDQGLRINDLADPTKKMSKSDETGKGVIFLTDTVEVAGKKIMAATTDSFEDVQYDFQARPGISNLLDIYELLGGDKHEFIGQKQYGPLKTAVSSKVGEFLSDFQKSYRAVDVHKVQKRLDESESKCNLIANQKLLEVQKAIGLR
jgi:tryptophanyl-tRNA synthetase